METSRNRELIRHRRTRTFAVATVAMLATTLCHSAPQIANPSKATHDKLGMTVVGADVDLSVTGAWYVVPAHGGRPGVSQLQLVPPKAVTENLMGKRAKEIRHEKNMNRGRSPLSQIVWIFHQHARKYQAKNRVSVADLDKEEKERLDNLVKTNPWKEHPDLTGPFFHIVGDIAVEYAPAEEKRPHRKPTNTRLLAVELHPYIDDGKHWVVFTNSQARRENIDKAFAEAEGIRIDPVIKKGQDELPTEGMVTYRVLGLLQEPAGKVQARLRNAVTDEEMVCDWDFSGATAGDPTMVTKWARIRAAGWQSVASRTESPVIEYWLSRHDELYGTAIEKPRRSGRNRRGRETSAFNVLGGRAAMRETLQMQAIGGGPEGAAQEASVPIGDIPGVEVKSHPFEEMLAGEPGGKLSLANNVPEDRFFVYVQKPQALLAFLDKGADFLFRLGSTSVGSSVRHDLKTRYLQKLGMDEEWLRTMLQTGFISEMGVTMPDLFLIDGTDMTVLVRIPQLASVRPVLAMIGVAGLEEGVIQPKKTPSGDTAYWTTAGDLLLVSTNQGEIQRVLATRGAKGKGSLGQSSELRYMLTQLPITDKTRVYAYFSDPFIRRLVGPAVKIGQCRRLRARAGMETLTSSALLYLLDGHIERPTLPLLADLGYVPGNVRGGDLILDDDLAAESGTWGMTNRMATLLERPVDAATQHEADMYKRYVDSYSRFWRRFFDPIAVRLDDTADGGLSLTTFILPLLDNSMYQGIRTVLATGEHDADLRVPQLSPDPVLLLSLNLTDEAWKNILKEPGEWLWRYTGIGQGVFDELGPSIHFALQDSDPVIALGSGDLLGSFGRGSRMFGRGAEMLGIPIMLSVLTRPSSLLIELRNPQEVIKGLRSSAASVALHQIDREVQSAFYQLSGRDAWIYRINFFGMVSLRFGIEVREGYLVITNLPWSQKLEIADPAPAKLKAAFLELRPAAVEKQLAAMFTAASDKEREAAMHGIGLLMPLIMTGSTSVPDAMAMHRRMFGYEPVHPAGGAWQVKNGDLTSTRFGSLNAPEQPAFEPGKRDFGVCQGIEKMSLNMQLEDSGLRSDMRWRLVK